MRLSVKFLRKWHRYLGVSIALFVLPLVITGILLNHTSDAELDSTYVTQNWLLDWYHITQPEADFTYATGNTPRWVSQWDDEIYLDTQHLGNTFNRLTGVINVDDILVIGFNNEIWLVTSTGELVEKIQPLNNINNSIKKIGFEKLDNKKVIFIVTHKATLVSDDMLTSWFATDKNALTKQKISWSSSGKLPPEITTRVANTQRHHILKWERVIQDLHSGRLFGSIGVWVVDAIGLILLLLAATGFYMWLKRSKTRR